MSASTLKSWIDNGKSEPVAIVDVRDSDYIGGHIRSSVNVPSTQFLGRLNKLQSALAGRPKVVFHCQLSQQRGPSCAAAYARLLASKGIRNQEVYVLSGGFNEWARHYGNDVRYTEGFKADLYR